MFDLFNYISIGVIFSFINGYHSIKSLCRIRNGWRIREIQWILELICQVEHVVISGKAHMQEETNDKTQPEGNDDLSQGHSLKF